MDEVFHGRQPPPILAGWIGELVREVRKTQVQRLSQLRAQLGEDVYAVDYAPLAQAVAAAQAATRQVHLRELRVGWIDRLLGKHRVAHARFTAAFDRVSTCCELLKKEIAAVAESSKAPDTAARRAIVEIEIELNSLHTSVEHAVNWLQDMCEQMGQPAPGAPPDPLLEELARAARKYTAQLKQLQYVETLTRDARVRGMDVLTRRFALVAQVREDAEVAGTEWMRAIGMVMAEIKAGRDPAAAAARALESHDEMLKRLSLTGDSCSALRNEEHLFAQQLVTLRQEMELLL